MLILKSSIKLWIFGGSISHNIPTVLWKWSSLAIKDGWCQALEPYYQPFKLVKGRSLDVIHSSGAGVEVNRLPELIGVGAAAIAASVLAASSCALISKGMLLSNKQLMEISICQSRDRNSIDCSPGL